MFIYCEVIKSQEYIISGKLIDSNDSIIPAASVILLNKQDSSFIQGVISDNNGVFSMNNIHNGDYELTIQHLIYQKKNLYFTIQKSLNLGEVELANNKRELSEVSIKAVRPVVKMEHNTLIYNASVISEKFVRNNGLEVLGDVPGVLLKNDEVQLIGAGNLNIAINGKPTSLSFEQVIAMLKAMPQENIKEIQVMYSPPPKYNVKGSLINIVLNKANKNQYNGSVYAGLRQRYESGGNGGINIQTSTHKWDINMMYSGDYDHIITKYQIDIDHTYQDTLYEIRQSMKLPSKNYEHNLQLSTDYLVDSLNTITFSYVGNYNKEKGGLNETYATYTSSDNYYTEIDSSQSNSTENMHNIKLEYSLKDKLQVGIDYTYYTGPSTYNYVSLVDDEITIYKTISEQTINKWMGYFNHSIKLGIQPISYGLNYQYSGNKNFYHYYDYENGYVLDDTESTDNDFTETEISGFISFERQFNKKLSLDFSLKGENSQMNKDTLDTQLNLWNIFKLYPSFNISYNYDEQYNHILKVSGKSYSNYPSYWEISPATYYTSQYMQVKGTPDLKPSQTYEAELNYIFKRKYVFVLSYNYTDGMITQIPYASTESFNTIAENTNIDFSSDLIAALVLPYQFGELITINPTLVYMHRHMKNSGSIDTYFNRTSDSFIFQYSSSFNLIKNIGLKAEISGYYHGAFIQGIYDIKPIYDVSCALSCNLFKDKATINMKMKDIFDTNSAETYIDYNNQNSHYNLDNDTRMLQVTVRYNFGKPFKTEKINIDKSRFKRLQ
jgi:hypothetical protein